SSGSPEGSPPPLLSPDRRRSPLAGSFASLTVSPAAASGLADRLSSLVAPPARLKARLLRFSVQAGDARPSPARSLRSPCLLPLHRGSLTACLPSSLLRLA